MSTVTTPKTEPNLDILRSLVDVSVGIPTGGVQKPLTYLVMRSGLFEVKSIPTARIIRKLTPDGVVIPTLADDLTAGIHLTVPKVPWTHMESILAFFKSVYDAHKSEAYASLWLDPTNQTYEVHIPEQRVTGASVKHEQDFDPGGDKVHVLDIHSHGSMGAFFSGGDDADECKAERFYGVVGNLDKAVPVWKFRLRLNGAFVDINPTLILEANTLQQLVNVNMVDALSASGNAKDGKVTFEVVVAPFTGTFPPAWMDQLKTHMSVVPFTDRRHGGMGNTGAAGVGTNFDGPPRLSKKDRKKGIIYIYIAGTCYREYPNGYREEVMAWPGRDT